MSDKAKKSFVINDEVTYNPNGADHGSRPKNTPVAGKVVNVVEKILYAGTDKEKTISVANLVVFQDNETGTAVKRHVMHIDDAKSLAADKKVKLEKSGIVYFE